MSFLVPGGILIKLEPPRVDPFECRREIFTELIKSKGLTTGFPKLEARFEVLSSRVETMLKKLDARFWISN